MRVLLAEDDDHLREVLERGLRENGYVVDSVATGDDALHMLEVNEYALAVLDWRMPGLPGIDVVIGLRRKAIPVGVLMLTARDSRSDRVQGLDAGADDYLVKPFDFEELLARLRALQRRPRVVAAPHLTHGALDLDPAHRQVRANGSGISLTRTEFAILELLMRRAPSVVGRDTIASQAWDDETDPMGSNTIEVHVARLRRKVAVSGVEIQAVRGIGYRLVGP
jgi:two-component system copper resistance phosphate regulon response regulator CusR